MPSIQQIKDYFNNNDMPEYAKEVEKLEDKVVQLQCLEEAGVDNWIGYEYSWELMEERYPEVYGRL